METIIELIRDQAWGFVGAIFTLLAIPFAYWIYLKQKAITEIAYAVISKQPLVMVDDKVATSVAITFNGQSVDQLTLLVIALKNTGTTAIQATDFVTTPKLELTGGEAVSTEIRKQVPSNLGMAIVVSSTSVQLSKVCSIPVTMLLYICWPQGRTRK